MLRNYLKTAFRNLLRQKGYALVNIFGLGVGLAFCLLIVLFVQDELSFDRFHSNANRIYRLQQTNLLEPAEKGEDQGVFNMFKKRQLNKMVRLPYPLGPLLQEDIPEVEQYLRFTEGEALLSFGGRTFREEVRYVDPNFFQMFSFRLKQGAPETVLQDPTSIVLTEKTARKYFGDADPVGQPLEVGWGEKKSFTVTGVAEEAPGNSSLTFNVLLPFVANPMYAYYKDELFNCYCTYTFVQLKEKASAAAFQRQLNRFKEYRFAQWEEGIRQEQQVAPSQRVSQLSFLPLTYTHFDTSVYWPMGSNPLYTYILSSLGLLILLIACINYLSLGLTNAASRLQEISIRKVIGARRWQLVGQLWAEAQLLVVLAVWMAIVLTSWLVLPLNHYTERQLTFSLFQQPVLIGVLVALTLLVGVVVGGYPALFLSRFEPVKELKGNRTYRVNPWFSRVLVVVQYSLCLFLITSTLIMYRQLHYISQKDMGFDKEQVLVLRNYAGEDDKNLQLGSLLKQYAATHPAIQSVGSATTSFGRYSTGSVAPINGQDVRIETYNVDADYLPTLGLQLVAGRNFSSDRATDKEAIIINETLAAMLGDSLVVGEEAPFLRQQVIGVVNDHHFASLESKIGPMMLLYRPQQAASFLVKVQEGQVPEAVAGLEKFWKEIAPDQPFDYSFLDQDLAAMYKTYKQWMGLIGWSSVFAVFISCLGLFSLSGISALNRTKEIGIRKVLGASVAHLFLLLNRETVLLAVLAFGLAVPLAGYLMGRWLQDFAYRISLTWDVYALAGLIGVTTAVLAVSFYSLKAALANPVKSLRNE